jgi:hypothetical protein
VFALSCANLRRDHKPLWGRFPAIETQLRAPLDGGPGLHGRWPSAAAVTPANNLAAVSGYIRCPG